MPHESQPLFLQLLMLGDEGLQRHALSLIHRFHALGQERPVIFLGFECGEIYGQIQPLSERQTGGLFLELGVAHGAGILNSSMEGSTP